VPDLSVAAGRATVKTAFEAMLVVMLGVNGEGALTPLSVVSM